MELLVNGRQTMNFWLRNIVLGILLLGLLYAFFANQELLLSLDPNYKSETELTDNTDNAETNDDISTDQDKSGIKINSDNAAAEGLSNFYASIRADIDKKGPKIRNNVVFLPDPKGSLEKILEARRMVTRPLMKTWKGKKANRPFRKGETLFQKLSQYANDDGLEVIWWLNRDLVVKDAFRIDKTVIHTAYLIGLAIEGHFPNGLSSYFCYQQRAIVIVEGNMDYLNKECTQLDT